MTSKHFTENKKLNLSYNPWFCWVLFSFSSALLIYARYPLGTQLWIVLFGILFPFVTAVVVAPVINSKQIPSYQQELFSATGFYWKWVWFVLTGILLITRFAKMDTPAWWLSEDDGLMALYSLQWLQGWHLKAFVTLGQDPSTLSHFCFGILKLTRSLFLSYQLPPAIVSCLTAWLAYKTSRKYFSKSASILIFSLFILSTWPMAISWRLLPGVLSPLWVWMFFYTFACFQQAIDARAQKLWAVAVGFTLGLGPYTFFSWPALFVLGYVMVFLSTSRLRKKSYLVLAALGSFASLFPFFWAALRDGYGQYIFSVAGFSEGFSWAKQISIAMAYVSSIFWGSVNGVWVHSNDEFLNIILGSSFFLGSVELIRNRWSGISISLIAAVALFLTPGVLSHDVESHRILLLLPVLLTVAAIGLQALFLTIPPVPRPYLLVLFLVISLVMDLTRADIPLNWNSASGSTRNERFFSYEILKPIADKLGPGLLFTEMIPNTKDFSLTYCTYSFNCALNPKLPIENAQWAAIFTENHYTPLLQRRFPQLQWFNLPTTDPHISSSHVLGWLPLTAKTRPVFLQWIGFQRFQLQNDLKIIDSPSGKPLQESLKDFLDFYSLVPKDVFLQSCYFQRLVFLYSAEKAFNPQDTWTNWQRFSPVFHSAFNRSCQSIFLCERFARILMMEGKDQESNRVLKQALRLSPRNPWLEYQLEQTAKP